MEYLHTSLFLLLLFCSPWPSVGKTYFTHLGTKCTSECRYDNGYYKCETSKQDGKFEQMYCSPKEHYDYRNYECSGICDRNGESYYWCKTGWFWGSWGYCGMVMEDEIHYGSKTGARCYDTCARKSGNFYYSCNTAQGSDYCSPFENRDYERRQCKEDSPCGRYDHNYNWCKLKEGGWGYCGLVKTELHHTRYHYTCIDECRYDETKKFYKCNIPNNMWDYCSPRANVTYKDKPCRSDHPCGSYDKNHNWCFTSQSEYDFCGPIESRHRNKRDLEGRTLACTQEDKDNIKISNFTVVPAPHDITDGSQWRNEAETLISRWDNGYLVDQARSNLIHSDHLRIDIQGIITRKNQLYYDLQVKMRRRPGTTVSQIIVSRGIPECYIHRAFMESFRSRARVYVDVSRG